MSKNVYLVSSAYQFSFFSEKELDRIEKKVSVLAKELNIFGLFILAEEGFNFSFSGTLEKVQLFKKRLAVLLEIDSIFYKDNFSNFSPFFKLKIKRKNELMSVHQKFHENFQRKKALKKVKGPQRLKETGEKTIETEEKTGETGENKEIGKTQEIGELEAIEEAGGSREIKKTQALKRGAKEFREFKDSKLLRESKESEYLSPRDWNHRIKEGGDLVCVLDVRNEYEVKIGKFKKAVSLNLREFSEFEEVFTKSVGADLSKEKLKKEYLIYCTGGIRCEKASQVMKGLGLKGVYQLKGGILNYLSQYPGDEFQGECFVFDHRVAVDQKLAPSRIYSICPHCGDPGKREIFCIQCKRKGVLCDSCYLKDESLRTCSKNCAHHFRMGHRSRRIHKDGFFSRKWKKSREVLS